MCTKKLFNHGIDAIGWKVFRSCELHHIRFPLVKRYEKEPQPFNKKRPNVFNGEYVTVVQFLSSLLAQTFKCRVRTIQHFYKGCKRLRMLLVKPRTHITYIEWAEISGFQNLLRFTGNNILLPLPSHLSARLQPLSTSTPSHCDTSILPSFHPPCHSICTHFDFIPSPPPCSPGFSDLWFMAPALRLKHEYFTRTKYNFLGEKRKLGNKKKDGGNKWYGLSGGEWSSKKKSSCVCSTNAKIFAGLSTKQQKYGKT